MANLDELEARLQSILEVQLVKYLPGHVLEDGLPVRLATALRQNVKEVAGVFHAPNYFLIVANSTFLKRWQNVAALMNNLSSALFIAGKEAGFTFSTKPKVSTSEDDHLGVDELRVIASYSDESLSKTQEVPILSQPKDISDNAFLIIEGNRIALLNRSVTNNGRLLDNHIVLEDGRVSRVHAQLRIIKERFVLFDINSSSGTFVNGQRINQCDLQPGDVISLGGVNLIFGQENQKSEPGSEGSTEPNPSVLPEDKTHILRK